MAEDKHVGSPLRPAVEKNADAGRSSSSSSSSSDSGSSSSGRSSFHGVHRVCMHAWGDLYVFFINYVLAVI